MVIECKCLVDMCRECIMDSDIAQYIVVFCFSLTQTVVPIICQHEAIIAHTPVVSRNVDAVVHTTTIVVIVTFIHIYGTNKIAICTFLLSILF